MKLTIFVNNDIIQVKYVSERTYMCCIICILNYAAFGEGGRYIVFFAESPGILQQTVVDKMFLSERFCMTVPTNHMIVIPENLEKLVSYKK